MDLFSLSVLHPGNRTLATDAKVEQFRRMGGGSWVTRTGANLTETPFFDYPNFGNCFAFLAQRRQRSVRGERGPNVHPVPSPERHCCLVNVRAVHLAPSERHVYSPALPRTTQAPEGRNDLRGCDHFAPPGLGWFWAGQGYEQDAPKELNERRALRAIGAAVATIRRPPFEHEDAGRGFSRTVPGPASPRHLA